MLIFAVIFQNNVIMFDKETYIRRRKQLKELVGDGLIVLFGNNISSANSPNNG